MTDTIDLKKVGKSISSRLDTLESEKATVEYVQSVKDSMESDFKTALEELIVEYGGTVPDDDEE